MYTHAKSNSVITVFIFTVRDTNIAPKSLKSFLSIHYWDVYGAALRVKLAASAFAQTQFHIHCTVCTLCGI